MSCLKLSYTLRLEKKVGYSLEIKGIVSLVDKGVYLVCKLYETVSVTTHHHPQSAKYQGGSNKNKIQFKHMHKLKQYVR